jgi:hypothetical protein
MNVTIESTDPSNYPEVKAIRMLPCDQVDLLSDSAYKAIINSLSSQDLDL